MLYHQLEMKHANHLPPLLFVQFKILLFFLSENNFSFKSNQRPKFQGREGGLGGWDNVPNLADFRFGNLPLNKYFAFFNYRIRCCYVYINNLSFQSKHKEYIFLIKPSKLKSGKHWTGSLSWHWAFWYQAIRKADKNNL